MHAGPILRFVLACAAATGACKSEGADPGDGLQSSDGGAERAPVAPTPPEAAAGDGPAAADAPPPRQDVSGDAFRFPEHSPPGCVPDCLWRLFTECTPPPSVSCQNQQHPDGALVVCYSSGVRTVTTFGPPRTTTDYRSEGSVC